ncbi:MAG TPA: HD domain-containing protein [Bacillota bacterium]|nr:HD domain-containing protein [Bacillota bacterium]
MTPRDRHDILKDEVHGYIRLSHRPTPQGASERDLVDSPWVQRLRRIRQLQAAWYVYPSADHSRFIHSLAVMELAGRFARSAYRPFWEQAAHSVKKDIPSLQLVEQTFRIAGLLHDVGHLPFSHLADTIFLARHDLTHETLGTHIIRTYLADIIRQISATPDGEELETPVDLDIVCNLIESGRERDLPLVWKALGSVLRGPCDADKMDFLLRDGRSLGLDGISPHEVQRLVLTSFIFPEKGSAPVFCLDRTSFPALVSLLRQRQYLTSVAYHHRTVKAFEEQLRPELSNALNELLPEGPCECPQRLLACDEDLVHQTLKRNQNGAWSRLMRRQIDWQLAYETLKSHEKVPAPIDRLSVNQVKDSLEGLPQDAILVSVQHYDAPPALRTGVCLYDRSVTKLRYVGAEDFRKQGILIGGEFVKVYVRRESPQLRDQVVEKMTLALGESPGDPNARGLLTSW